MAARSVAGACTSARGHAGNCSPLSSPSICDSPRASYLTNRVPPETARSEPPHTNVPASAATHRTHEINARPQCAVLLSARAVRATPYGAPDCPCHH